MSVISQPKPRVLDETCDIPSVAIYRLTVEQYHQIVRAGIIGEDEPVELLKGWLVRKMGKKPPHRFATESTREALGERWRYVTPGFDSPRSAGRRMPLVWKRESCPVKEYDLFIPLY